MNNNYGNQGSASKTALLIIIVAIVVVFFAEVVLNVGIIQAFADFFQGIADSISNLVNNTGV